MGRKEFIKDTRPTVQELLCQADTIDTRPRGPGPALWASSLPEVTWAAMFMLSSTSVLQLVGSGLMGRAGLTLSQGHLLLWGSELRPG